MRKLLILAIIFLASKPLFAQIELSGYYGWQWTGSVPMYYYPGFYPSQNAKVDDKANYGVRAGIRLPSYLIGEFEWNHTETNFIYRDIDDRRVSIPISANYYWLGIIRELQEGPAIPYGILNIGVANFKDMDQGDNITAFAMGLGGGIKYFFSDHVGIRLQARLMAPMMFGGLTLGCGIGTGGAGCGAGASTYSTIIQGDFTGGIILKLGGDQ